MKNQTVVSSQPLPDLLDPVAKSQRALRKIMDSSVDVICIIDKAGYFLKVGAASLKIWGYTPDELAGTHSGSLVFSEDQELTRQVFLQIMEGLEVTYFENRFCCKDGTLIPLIWSARWDEEEEVMYCIARDGREKKRIEQELLDKQSRLQKMQQMAKIGGWEYDLIHQRTRWASDQLYEIFGISREEYPEISVAVFRELVHPDDLDRVTAELSDKRKLDNHFIEHRIIRTDGQVSYIRQCLQVICENDTPVLLTGVVQDITGSRVADQLLVANERRYRTLVHNGFEMINILDADGNFLYVTDSIYRILGYDPKDLIGTNAFDLIHPNDVVRMAKAFARLYTESYVEDFEPYRFKNSKGEWRWLESKGANMLYDSAINGLVINSRDITDKKIMQERFEKQVVEWQSRMNKAAIQAQEQERTQLSRELHDNVNQVLTTVKLYTELCLDKHPDQQLLLEKSADYLNDCINEIRSISKRLSSPVNSDTSLKESIEELIASIQLTNKLHIKLNIKADQPRIGHEIHLCIYRIVQEHMTNILKHAEASQVDINIQVNKSAVAVMIKDNGKGFNINAQRKGIGINNMQSRAESMNGTLTIDSKPLAGCTLNLSIPLKVTVTTL